MLHQLSTARYYVGLLFLFLFLQIEWVNIIWWVIWSNRRWLRKIKSTIGEEIREREREREVRRGNGFVPRYGHLISKSISFSSHLISREPDRFSLTLKSANTNFRSAWVFSMGPGSRCEWLMDPISFCLRPLCTAPHTVCANTRYNLIYYIVYILSIIYTHSTRNLDSITTKRRNIISAAPFDVNLSPVHWNDRSCIDKWQINTRRIKRVGEKDQKERIYPNVLFTAHKKV